MFRFYLNICISKIGGWGVEPEQKEVDKKKRFNSIKNRLGRLIRRIHHQKKVKTKTKDENERPKKKGNGRLLKTVKRVVSAWPAQREPFKSIEKRKEQLTPCFPWSAAAASQVKFDCSRCAYLERGKINGGKKKRKVSTK